MLGEFRVSRGHVRRGLPVYYVRITHCCAKQLCYNYEEQCTNVTVFCTCTIHRYMHYAVMLRPNRA